LKAAVLFSGGKDSTYALHLAVLQGYDIAVLLTVIPVYDYSMLYHKPLPELVRMQADAMGFPCLMEHVREEGDELNALKKLLARARSGYGVEVLVTGAVASDYQRMLFSMVAGDLGLDTYNPLWGIDQEKYLKELVEHGFEFMIVSITTHGLPPKYLGRALTLEDVIELSNLARKYGFNPAFEGGEAETLVLDAPLFRKRLVVEGYVVERGFHDYVYVIEKASLASKNSSQNSTFVARNSLLKP